MRIAVQIEDFDVSHELAELRKKNPAIGAIVNFVGLVRDVNEGQKISAMALEHYPGMTEKSLQDIAKRAIDRWQLCDALIIHRIGNLQLMDQIVMVAAASAHRGDAFAACEFMMDYLKTEAPFWKKESTQAGERWVDAREADEVALQKWDSNQGV
ncbi:molybdenum cofactor biosynthesis protein MoaE [Undibacterium fentianense]|uniref:Molybdopterin synthase catalytic subunit n=1 Tax=Undibacterium fentianense TaxID=2828728 RepID=A0A941E2Y2_9BURK|nr:molybdenum cofactor biosynthesis protein MoaE [Undibacterium fentianense]MBR7800021.1 molybdenum cofactor biosynthesis protein MoaE [Undibacterium fentianense]